MPELNKYGKEVFTKEEADKLGIQYVSWKDVGPNDRYICTDDNYVGRVRSYKVYKHHNGTSTYVSTDLGRRFVDKASSFLYAKQRDSGTLSSVIPQKWIDREAKRERARNAVRVYVATLLAGRVDWNAVGLAYRRDQQVPAATVKRLFKQQRIQNMVREELRQVFADANIDEAFVLDTIKEAIDIAKAKKEASNLLRAAEDLSDLLDMKPSTSKASYIEEFSFTGADKLQHIVRKELEAGNGSKNRGDGGIEGEYVGIRESSDAEHRSP